MIKFAVGASFFGAGATFLFGTWSPLMGILLVLIALDIITGVFKGFYDKSLRSRNMSQGMIRKAMIFVVLILATMIDVGMFAGMPVAKTAVLSFYIGLEGLSILENLGQMGVPLPDAVKQYLLVLRDKGQSQEEDKKKKEDKLI